MELETKKLTASEILKLKIQNGEISSFFDCLTDILLKYSNEKILENQDFKKYFNSYMICRYISMKESLITYAENLNIVQNILTPEQFYKLAYKLALPCSFILFKACFAPSKFRQSFITNSIAALS